MKVLFLSDGSGQDYMRDCVAHGLRTLLGPDFVDVGKLDSLYIGADKSQMYGKGFTLYSLLPDIPVDRTDIPKKISKRYFDIVIYGSIHRNQSYLHEVTSQYAAPNLIAIDGEDHAGYLSGLPLVTFKRELYNHHPGCLPIHFAIPKERILYNPPPKNMLMAPMDPAYKNTYRYNDEASYLQQYSDSFYGPTMKKAGWDCLRHYEMLSQWCLPYFRVFDQCPPLICQHLPRPELRTIQSMWDISCQYKFVNRQCMEMMYEAFIGECMKAMRDHCTTTALAAYIFDSIKEISCA